MTDVDVRTENTPHTSKIQLEQQQPVRYADVRDMYTPDIVYPDDNFRFSLAKSPTLVELVLSFSLLIVILLCLWRIFGVSAEDKTGLDVALSYIFISTIGLTIFLSFLYVGARVLNVVLKSNLFTLPNGLPIAIKEIVNNYTNLGDSIINKTGYYEVEHVRAGNPLVAPGEITYTFSPQNTYAPSNMPRTEQDSNNDLLNKLLEADDTPEEEEPALPKFVNFFEYLEEKEPGHVIAGVRADGSAYQIPIMNMFNHLVGGAVGSGKSIYLRSLVYQFLIEADESDIPLKLALADIENNTFPEFRGCRHVDWYASNYVEIEHMTTSLLKEVERRKTLYEGLSSTPKDIERYNVLARREAAEELPIIVVLYDEFSALMHRSQAQQKRILADILQLALRSRKYGIFLVIAGQSFKADLIDSAVLGQFNFNVAFRVRSNHASISILGEPGAEKLRNPGEALIRQKDGAIEHIQGLYFDDDELLNHLEDFKDDSSKTAEFHPIVKEIIAYAHESMGDKVKFRELEVHLGEKGVGRADLIKYLDWMDQHKLTIRGEKNARFLNWSVIQKMSE